MTIDGFGWFIAALLLCGLHALYIRDWRRERREQLAASARYDAESERRHQETMRALAGVKPASLWQQHRERGQA